MSYKSMDVSLNLQPNRSNSKITLSWKDISVWATKKKETSFWASQQYEHIRILNKVSGYVSSGNLMAIMGASGAGKTTLMATISQRVKGTDTVGEIMVNGKIITKEMMSRLSGFVPQNELITKTLTVQEHMQFMARLMMDTRVTETQRNRRISSLLSELGLAKTTYTILNELSGGELKRVSLAVQLLTDPVLLFCDEPTTGLDSYNAGIVVESLKSFASRGKAVICTIHQPASGLFDLFHEVLLLASGRVAFHGSVSDATNFFESLNLKCPVGYNQAEFYVTQLAITVDDAKRSTERVQKLCDEFAKSKYGEALRQHVFDGAEETGELEGKNRVTSFDDDLLRGHKEFQKYSNIQKISWCVQLYWLLWRSSINTNRSRHDVLLRFSLYMFIALLLALPYIHIADRVDQKNIQNVEGLMYLIITETVFTFSYSVFHTFPEEIPQLLREIGNDLYKPSSFYVAKILLSIPGAIIMPLAYTTLIFWIVGLQGGFWGFILFCIPVIASAIASTAYGYAMSAVFESVAIAALVSVPIDFVCVVFSGIYINLANLPLHLTWLRYISPFYYGTEAISILQWSNVDDIKCDSPSLPCIRTGQQVLDKYGFDSNGFYFDLLGLAGYYIVLQIIGYIGFWRRSKRQSIY